MITTLAFAPLTADAVGLPAPGGVSAAIPLFVIAILLWLRRLPRVAAMLALLAGSALSTGWLYLTIHTVLGGITTVINTTLRTTLGSAVPGALAMVMAIYYVLAIRLDKATVERLLSARNGSWRTLGRSHTTSSSYGGGGYAFAGALTTGEKTRKGWPDKLGALIVGLALPAVVTSIPGTVGDLSVTSVNVIGGLMAAGLEHTIGIR
jgi:hypothetical protein